MRTRYLVLLLLMFFGVVMRFLPHPPNFTPIGALGLFGGAYFGSKRMALGVMWGAMLLSDLVLGVYTLMPVVYLAFAGYVFIGYWLVHRKNIVTVPLGALTGALLFFLVTNAAVWWSWYPHTFTGLTSCFVAAIPFFQNSVCGDLIYAGSLFGAFALAERYERVPVLRDTLLRTMDGAHTH